MGVFWRFKRLGCWQRCEQSIASEQDFKWLVLAVFKNKELAEEPVE